MSRSSRSFVKQCLTIENEIHIFNRCSLNYIVVTGYKRAQKECLGNYHITQRFDILFIPRGKHLRPEATVIISSLLSEVEVCRSTI